MTIQPAPMGQKFKFKVNELQPREILRKANRRGGHWKRYQVFATPEAARNAILSLQKDEDDDD